MECAKKILPACSDEHYPNDRTCKDCRKEVVRRNRAAKIDYYREYDKTRFQEDPRVKVRHKKYQTSDAGKASLRKAKSKWTGDNPVKRGANVIVGNAVRDGRLFKPTECGECGGGGRIHGHHDNYAYPLVVRWLCPQCHTDWHKANGEGENG